MKKSVLILIFTLVVLTFTALSASSDYVYSSTDDYRILRKPDIITLLLPTEFSGFSGPSVWKPNLLRETVI